MFGSYIETGLQSDFCFDRHARYDPYGYDENDLEGLPIPQASRSSPVIWDKVNWGLLQGDCFLRNQDRYQPAPMSNRSSTTFWLPSQQDFDEVNKTIVFTDDGASGGVSYRLWKSARNYKQRTAIVIHPWDGNEWSVDTMQHLRSMIMELSLHSGAEYEVIIMVEIKDAVIPIFEDPAKYREALLKSVPAEFGNITMLFNRQLLEKWYPKVGQHG